MSLRIISGELKGRKLHSVRGMMTRPTADRVRESIFNILSFRIQGTIVLDLFAGTGALGIEALSRGAAEAVFIDKSMNALSVMERNIRMCGLDHRAKILRWDILRNLSCIGSKQPAFNLVLIDPPYNKNIIIPTLQNLHASNSLEQEACIMVEHSVIEPIPEKICEFTLMDQRKYGKTLVSFLVYDMKPQI